MAIIMIAVLKIMLGAMISSDVLQYYFQKLPCWYLKYLDADKMNDFAGKSIQLKTVMCIRGIIWLSHLIKLEMGLSWLQQE